jgi:hypothetical protein
MNTKQKIIEIFKNNIKGKEIFLEKYNNEGYWLENNFGIKHNSKNEPDIFGYELKKFSKKITLGDFSASEYIFSTKKCEINTMNNWKENINFSRSEFIKTFGNQNPKKNNRYSWSWSGYQK